MPNAVVSNSDVTFRAESRFHQILASRFKGRIFGFAFVVKGQTGSLMFLPVGGLRIQGLLVCHCVEGQMVCYETEDCGTCPQNVFYCSLYFCPSGTVVNILLTLCR